VAVRLPSVCLLLHVVATPNPQLKFNKKCSTEGMQSLDRCGHALSM